MKFNKTYIALLVFALLNLTPASTQSNQPWKIWESLRWAGLEEFRKNKLDDAQKYFEQALAEAKHVKPNGQNQVISMHDLAQVYDAKGKLQQAEKYYNLALELSKNNFSNGATTMLILHSLEYLKREETKYDEVGRIEETMNKLASASPDSRTIGVATMKPDGTIVVNSRIEGPGKSIGHAINSYTVSDPEYRKVLMHIGPLKPDDSKFVTPLE
jgi:tetratricopeptide (TPR) repeat protein